MSDSDASMASGPVRHDYSNFVITQKEGVFGDAKAFTCV